MSTSDPVDMWIIVPKWAEFQHYKDRSPRWIKNYTRLLSDDAYLSLTYAQRGLLHGIWLLYASSNEAPTSTRTKHLLTTNKGEARHFLSNLKALETQGFIHLSASKPLATPYQPASPEKETEKKELTRAHARTTPTPEYRCTAGCRNQTFRTHDRLRDHLENVHWLDGPNLEQALQGGTP